MEIMKPALEATWQTLLHSRRRLVPSLGLDINPETLLSSNQTRLALLPWICDLRGDAGCPDFKSMPLTLGRNTMKTCLHRAPTMINAFASWLSRRLHLLQETPGDFLSYSGHKTALPFLSTAYFEPGPASAGLSAVQALAQRSCDFAFNFDRWGEDFEQYQAHLRASAPDSLDANTSAAQYMALWDAMYGRHRLDKWDIRFGSVTTDGFYFNESCYRPAKPDDASHESLWDTFAAQMPLTAAANQQQTWGSAAPLHQLQLAQAQRWSKRPLTMQPVAPDDFEEDDVDDTAAPWEGSLQTTKNLFSDLSTNEGWAFIRSQLAATDLAERELAGIDIGEVLPVACCLYRREAASARQAKQHLEISRASFSQVAAQGSRRVVRAQEAFPFAAGAHNRAADTGQHQSSPAASRTLAWLSATSKDVQRARYHSKVAFRRLYDMTMNDLDRFLGLNNARVSPLLCAIGDADISARNNAQAPYGRSLVLKWVKRCHATEKPILFFSVNEHLSSQKCPRISCLHDHAHRSW